MKQETWRRYAEWPLMVAALVFLVAYSIEVIGDVPDSRSAPLDWVIWITWGLFVIDFAVNVILAERRARWLVRNIHELVILALPVLRPLRLLRLLVLLRFLRSFAGQALRGRVIAYAIGGAILLTYVGALAVLDAEQNVHGSNIRSFGTAIWWAVVTLTTVGYGDHYPIIVIGRCVAVALMIGGIALLGIITASIASWLVEQVGTKVEAETNASEALVREELERVTARVDELSATLARQNELLERLAESR